MSTVQQYLGVPESWPVKEKLTHEIVLMPNKRDIKTAKRHDPQACALHNAACRMFDIPNCAIGGRWAYIPQRDAKGKWYIARMQAPAETQKAIKRFDKTGKMPEGGFRFMPIAPSHAHKYKRTYNRKWADGKVGHNMGPRKVKYGARRAVRGIPIEIRTGSMETLKVAKRKPYHRRSESRVSP